MKQLQYLDSLAFLPPAATRAAQLRLKRVLPRVKYVSAYDLEAQLETLAQMQGAYVLFLPAFVLPSSLIAKIAPDPGLLQAGFRVGWMSQNVVTSQFVSTPGPEIWLRADLMAYLESEGEQAPPRRATLPECQAVWAFNTSSGAAFTAGFEYGQQFRFPDLTAAERAQIGVAASFGSDVPFADWWHLGVLSAALGAKDRIASYDKEKAVNEADPDMKGRLADLVREVNLTHGLGITVISRENSAFFRQNRFLQPEREAYETIVSQYDSLGKSGRLMAEKYRAAMAWVWGG